MIFTSLYVHPCLPSPPSRQSSSVSDSCQKNKSNAASKFEVQLLPEVITMNCAECGTSYNRDISTACPKCKTPAINTGAPRVQREFLLPFAVDSDSGDAMTRRPNTQTIEERYFQGALICLELRYETKGGIGPKTIPEVKKMVGHTLELSLNKADVRYVLFNENQEFKADC